jgi:hypothetical protein
MRLRCRNGSRELVENAFTPVTDLLSVFSFLERDARD